MYFRDKTKCIIPSHVLCYSLTWMPHPACCHSTLQLLLLLKLQVDAICCTLNMSKNTSICQASLWHNVGGGCRPVGLHARLTVKLMWCRCIIICEWKINCFVKQFLIGTQSTVHKLRVSNRNFFGFSSRSVQFQAHTFRFGLVQVQLWDKNYNS